MTKVNVGWTCPGPSNDKPRKMRVMTINPFTGAVAEGSEDTLGAGAEISLADKYPTAEGLTLLQAYPCECGGTCCGHKPSKEQ